MIFIVFILHFLYLKLKIKILDFVYSLCLFLFSGKMNLELRALCCEGSLVNRPTRGDLPVRPSPRLSAASGAAAVQQRLPLLVLTMRER